MLFDVEWEREVLVWSALKCLTGSGHVGLLAENRMAFCTTTVRFCVRTPTPATMEAASNGAGVLAHCKQTKWSPYEWAAWGLWETGCCECVFTVKGIYLQERKGAVWFYVVFLVNNWKEMVIHGGMVEPKWNVFCSFLLLSCYFTYELKFCHLLLTPTSFRTDSCLCNWS